MLYDICLVLIVSPARYGVIKRLESKPFEMFKGSDQFLRIQGAVREGLVTLVMGIDAKKLQGLTDHVKLWINCKLYRNRRPPVV